MKRFKVITALLLTIALTFMTGCSNSKTSMNVDDSLRTLAQNESSKLSCWEDLKGGLEIKKLTNRYELVDVESGISVYYIDGVNEFYKQENPYENFVFEDPQKALESEYIDNLNKAKELAIDYIDSSTVIKAESKDNLKDTIKDVNIHYGSMLGEKNDLFTITPMRTYGTEIYITEGAERYFTIGVFLHELVHVISNETNLGSKYEWSFYRFSAINEGMTELITRQILINAGMKDKIEEEVTYEMFFPYVYALQGKVDLLEGYYYSDNFDTIFEGIERDWIDMYYMLVTWCPEEKIKSDNGVPFWAYSQF